MANDLILLGAGKSGASGGSVWTDTKAAQFDGVDERAGMTVSTTVNSQLRFTTSTPMSVGFYVYIPSQSGGSTKTILGHFGNNNDGVSARDYGWKFRYIVAGGGSTVTFSFLWSSASTQQGIATSSVLSTGTWYRVVGTYDGGADPTGMLIYIDGVDDTSSQTGTLSAGVGARNDTPFTVAAEWNANLAAYTSFGEIRFAELAIYDYELTSSQVSSDYNSGTRWNLKGMSTPPVGYFPVVETDDMTGTTGVIQDISGNEANMTPVNTESGDLVDYP